MKVRRKSEIAEAVRETHGSFLWLTKDGVTSQISAEEFAAHYEPVPEPPQSDDYQLRLWKSIRAQVNGSLEGIVEDGYSAGNIVFDYLSDAARMINSLFAYIAAAPSVSEEQPAIKVLTVKEIVENHAPHRATIAMIPCYREEGKFHIEIDGKLDRDDGYAFCGTEAEAKAKLESLRGR